MLEAGVRGGVLVGRAAQEALRRNPDDDPSGVLAKVTSGEADAGLVYVTDAAGAKDKVKIIDAPFSATGSAARLICTRRE